MAARVCVCVYLLHFILLRLHKVKCQRDDDNDVNEVQIKIEITVETVDKIYMLIEIDII